MQSRQLALQAIRTITLLLMLFLVTARRPFTSNTPVSKALLCVCVGWDSNPTNMVGWPVAHHVGCFSQRLAGLRKLVFLSQQGSVDCGGTNEGVHRRGTG